MRAGIATIVFIAIEGFTAAADSQSCVQAGVGKKAANGGRFVP